MRLRRSGEPLNPDGRWYTKHYRRPSTYRLIRVIKNLNELVAGKDGSVCIVRDKRHRQSIHFTINGPVSDHSQGSWDNDPFVIIADPKELGQPAVVNYQDTWYFTDKNNRLNLGHPIIIAPAGAGAPPGIKLTYYSGKDTEDERDTRDDAVERELKMHGIQMMDMEAHGADFGEIDSYAPGGPSPDPRKEVDAFLAAHNFNPNTRRGPHFYNPETDIEDYLNEMAALLEFLKGIPEEKSRYKGYLRRTGAYYNYINNPRAYAPQAVKHADERIESCKEYLIPPKNDDPAYRRTDYSGDTQLIEHIKRAIKIIQAYKRLFQRIAATPAN
jgi:hypothetical protein